MHILGAETRRKEVERFLCQSLTEKEIAERLGVDQSTISRDIAKLKQKAQRLIVDLAKSDLPFIYVQCINGINEVNRHAWFIYYGKTSKPKEKLAALKVVKECNEATFKLYQEGPYILAVKTLDERVKKIENRKEN